MSIFDALRKTAAKAIGSTASQTIKAAASQIGNKTETFTFSALPATLSDLKALPEASLDTPFKAAALTVCALCTYASDAAAGEEMLNYLKGPQPLTPFEKQFLHDRLQGKTYLLFSYFKGAVPSNNYQPQEPFTISVSTNPYSYQEEGYVTLWLTSGGADSPRQVKLRQKGSQYFLWEQFLMSDIRIPKSEDPWA